MVIFNRTVALGPPAAEYGWKSVQVSMHLNVSRPIGRTGFHKGERIRTRQDFFYVKGAVRIGTLRSLSSRCT